MQRSAPRRAAHLVSLPIVLACLLAAAPVHATKYAGEFLKVPVGARAIGMGGAFTAVADDATAPWWNPAGMVYLPYREVLPQHQEKFGRLVNHDYLGFVLPLDGPTSKHSAIGVGLVRLAVERVEYDGASGKVIAAAISEVARNIVLYARRGLIEIRGMNDRHRRGLTITARDEGPGIRDVGLALQDGYSTGEGFGLEPFDVELDEGRHAVLADQGIERGEWDLERLRPSLPFPTRGAAAGRDEVH